MLPRMLDERLSALIDDLLHEESVPTSLLASILLSAQESVKDGTLARLATELWKAREHAGEPCPPLDPGHPMIELERQLHSRSWPAHLLFGGASRD